MMMVMMMMMMMMEHVCLNNFRKNQRNEIHNKPIKFSVARKETGTILRLNKKKFEDEELSHELFLTTKETTKIIIVFANNMSTDIKLSKAQISKQIQSDRSLFSWLANLVKNALTNNDIPLATDNLSGLVSNLNSSAIHKFDRKNKWKMSCQSRKRTYFIYLK